MKFCSERRVADSHKINHNDYMPRIPIIDAKFAPGLQQDLEFFKTTLGFVPNSVLSMLPIPGLVKAYVRLNAAVMDPNGAVDLGFRRLLGYVSAHEAGYPYSGAQALLIARFLEVSEEKLADILRYHDSPHYSEAERVALDLAVAASRQPNGVTDELFERVREHWHDTQILEMVAVVGLYGFLGRWTASLRMPLEPVACAVAEQALGNKGWTAGYHAPED